MKRLNLSEVKANLGRYVKLVQRGETIVLMLRQRAVAKIVKLEPSDESEEGRLAGLEMLGVLTRSKHPLGKDFLRRHPPVKAQRSVLEALLEERAETSDR